MQVAKSEGARRANAFSNLVYSKASPSPAATARLASGVASAAKGARTLATSKSDVKHVDEVWTAQDWQR